MGQLYLVVELSFDLLKLAEHIANGVYFRAQMQVLLVVLTTATAARMTVQATTRCILSQISDDLRIDEVGLSAEASDQQGDDVAGLPVDRLHFNASVAVVARVDLRVGVEDAELPSVEGVQLDTRIVNRVFQ